MKADITTLTIKDAHTLLKEKKISAVDLVEMYLKSAQEQNKEINAYAEFFDDVVEQAKKADEMIASGKMGYLTGIPLGIKDNILIKGKIATSGSKILAGHRAIYSATVVEKLQKEGAVFLGRTNMDEFAMGSSTETCAYGPVKNPIDPSRVPGGSSGGSASSVAMNGALGALGSDTGGSIRQPASFTGLVGLKPTYGEVSRYGLMAMASSLDQIGPFAKTVDDAEIMFNAIRGYDPLDSTSAPDNHPQRKEVSEKKKITIGVPNSFISLEGLDTDVRNNFTETIEAMRADGHEVVNVDLPSLPYALSVYYVLMPAEVSANLARYDGIRYGLSSAADKLADVYTKTRGEGFGKEVRRRILLGTYVLSAGYYDAYYNKASAVRCVITRELMDVFAKVDVIATPTAPTPAFKIGEKTSDPLQMYLEDIFTVPANIAGIPGISVQSGTVLREGKKLPVGIQFMSKPFSETLLFTAGRSVEKYERR